MVTPEAASGSDLPTAGEPSVEGPAAGGFDRGAAVTRSMLGWGVVAGPFYLIFGLILALTRPGFDLGQHALSLLLLGGTGWLQGTNLVLSGAMVVVAAVGLARTPAASRAGAVLIGVYGLCLVLSAIFPPDAAAGFPPGSAGGSGSASGILHLAFGGIGFLCLGIAGFVLGAWFARRGARGTAGAARLGGAVVILGFAGGAALSPGPAGIALLWLAVVVGWALLALVSVAAYRAVPHPLLARRTATPPA